MRWHKRRFADLMVQIRPVRPIAHEVAGLDGFPVPEDHWCRVADRQRGDLINVASEQGSGLTTTAPTRCWAIFAKAGSISLGGLHPDLDAQSEITGDILLETQVSDVSGVGRVEPHGD